MVLYGLIWLSQTGAGLIFPCVVTMEQQKYVTHSHFKGISIAHDTMCACPMTFLFVLKQFIHVKPIEPFMLQSPTFHTVHTVLT